MLPIVQAARRCTAKANRTGRRCARAAIFGGTVCPTHGGSAPQVKRAAAERLAALVDPAIRRLADHVHDVEHPAVSLAAVKDVLDRTQGRAVETIEHRGSPIAQLSDAELRARAVALLAELGEDEG